MEKREAAFLHLKHDIFSIRMTAVSCLNLLKIHKHVTHFGGNVQACQCEIPFRNFFSFFLIYLLACLLICLFIDLVIY